MVLAGSLGRRGHGLAWAALPPRRIAVGAVVFALLLAAADVPLEVSLHTFGTSSVFLVIFALPYVAVGGVVARRVPANPIGWLLLFIGLAVLCSNDGSDYATFVYEHGHRGWPLGAVGVVLDAMWTTTLVPMPLVILLFPDGQLGPRWRRVALAYGVVGALEVVGDVCVGVAALAHRDPVDASSNVVGAAHPSGVAAWFATAQPILIGVFVVFCIGAVVRQALKYRVADGLHRQQLKWLGSSAAFCVVALVVTSTGLGTGAPTAVWLLVVLAWSALPLSIGIAILRYRLYEIDRIISRTLSYAILTVLLAGTFIGVVALTTDVLPLSSRVGVAASTLAAAALFNPLRVRVQRLVDRRFNRARYDAEATVAAFTARLRDAVEIEAVRADLLDTVKRAVEPSHVSVWIKP